MQTETEWSPQKYVHIKKAVQSNSHNILSDIAIQNWRDSKCDIHSSPIVYCMLFV